MWRTQRGIQPRRPTSTSEGPGGANRELAPWPESWAGNHGLDGVPTAAPPGAAGNDAARLEQGAWGAPKLQQCASERWGGPSLPGQGARCPQLQQYASERQPPAPTPWTGLREIWGKTVRGLLGPQVARPPPSRGRLVPAPQGRQACSRPSTDCVSEAVPAGLGEGVQSGLVKARRVGAQDEGRPPRGQRPGRPGAGMADGLSVPQDTSPARAGLCPACVPLQPALRPEAASHRVKHALIFRASQAGNALCQLTLRPPEPLTSQSASPADSRTHGSAPLPFLTTDVA